MGEIPNYWCNLRHAAAGYVLEFGEEKAQKIWEKHGGTGKPGYANGFPNTQRGCEQLYNAMFDEIIGRREKRACTYRYMKKANEAVESMKNIRAALDNQPFVGVLNAEELDVVIAKLEIDAKTARRLYIKMKPYG